MHYAPSITDGRMLPLIGNVHLLSCGSSIHPYPGDCWLAIPSGGIKAKWVVTTSNTGLVDMADFGDDLDIECDALAAKRSHDDEDTSSGESDRTSVRSASSESDADVVPRKRRRRGAYHKLEEGRIHLR